MLSAALFTERNKYYMKLSYLNKGIVLSRKYEPESQE